jgi:dephospho-CoA kinase
MLIGITGSFGAGKGLAANYLVKQKGFSHFSARSFITEEITRRGLPIDRDSMTVVANDLRQTYGPSYIFEQLVAKARAGGGDSVIESIRAVAEVEYIKANGGLVLGIDADPQVRYERIIKRGNETDHVSFDKWRQQEINESNPDDPTKQDIFGALKKSDYIINNTKTVAELELEIDKFLDKYND